MGLQAYGRLNMVSSAPCRRFIGAMAARAAEPGALDGNPHALGNVAWGLAVAQQLTPSLLQQARPRHAPVVLCGCEPYLLHLYGWAGAAQFRQARICSVLWLSRSACQSKECHALLYF